MAEPRPLRTASPHRLRGGSITTAAARSSPSNGILRSSNGCIDPLPNFARARRIAQYNGSGRSTRLALGLMRVVADLCPIGPLPLCIGVVGRHTLQVLLQDPTRVVLLMQPVVVLDRYPLAVFLDGTHHFIGHELPLHG